MARPRKNDDELHEERLTVRFSRAGSGWQKIMELAEKTGLPKAEIVRRLIEDGEVPVSQGADPAILAALIRIAVELSRQGNNINQQAYKANALGRVEAAAVLEAAFAENNATRDRLDAVIRNFL